MTFDDIFFVVSSSSSSSSSFSSSSSSSRTSDSRPKFSSANSLRLFAGVANFQFDDQMAAEAGHDFPVVLMAKDKNELVLNLRLGLLLLMIMLLLLIILLIVDNVVDCVDVIVVVDNVVDRIDKVIVVVSSRRNGRLVGPFSDSDRRSLGFFM